MRSASPTYEIREVPGASTCRVIVIHAPRGRGSFTHHIDQRGNGWVIAGGGGGIYGSPELAAEELVRQFEDAHAEAQR